MGQTNPKHLSPWIAWAVVALFAGIAGFCIWYYFFAVGTAYDNSVFDFVFPHHATTTTR